jgi:hypothetical protein
MYHFIKDFEPNSTVRVISLKQLSVAEFSGEYARLKAYENSHKII